MTPSLPLVFLDIDGVLNDHTFCRAAMSCFIERAMVQRLNRIILATDAKVVLSSAWRYLIHNGEVSLSGMEWLLRSHGLQWETLVGFTRKDTMLQRPNYSGSEEWPVDNERGQQIADWRTENRHVGPYVVLDDLDLGISVAGHSFVQTDGKVGLTDADVDRSLSLFRFQGVIPNAA